MPGLVGWDAEFDKLASDVLGGYRTAGDSAWEEPAVDEKRPEALTRCVSCCRMSMPKGSGISTGVSRNVTSTGLVVARLLARCGGRRPG